MAIALRCRTYLDRINQRPPVIIASPGDPDFDKKIQAAIRQKLEKAISSDRPQSDNSNTLNDWKKFLLLYFKKFSSYLDPLNPQNQDNRVG